MRKKKNKGAFWRQLNAITPNSVRMSLRMQSLSPHTMIQLKNMKEQKEGKSKKESVDLFVLLGGLKVVFQDYNRV
jgi:hypothetical protein